MGTQVPNNEYIEKVYINSNLTPKEMYDIFDQLNYYLYDGTLVYPIYFDSTLQKSIVVIKDGTNNQYVFAQNGLNGKSSEDLFVVQYVVESGEYKVYEHLEEQYEIVIEAENAVANMGVMIDPNYVNQNNLLTDLISTTPFKVTLGDFCETIAKAIRTKKQSTASINAQNFASEIEKIVTSEEATEIIKTIVSNNGNYLQTKSVRIPEGTTQIEKYFLYSTSSGPYWYFDDILDLPSTITSIGENSMKGIRGNKETNLVLGQNVTSLGKSTFQNCYVRGNVILNCSNVKTIPQEAFVGITYVKGIDVCEGINTISKDAFSNLYSNDNTATNDVIINLPSTLNRVYNSSFSLSSIAKVGKIINFNMTFEDYLNNVYVGYSSSPSPSQSDHTRSIFLKSKSITFTDGSIPENVIFKRSTSSSYNNEDYGALNACPLIKTLKVSSYSKLGFAQCENLEKVEIASDYDYNTLSSYMFYNCQKLKEVVIKPSSTLYRISGTKVFANCPNLTYIELPEQITDISAQDCLAIGSSTNKATIKLNSTTPPTVSTSTFNKSYLNKIFVPKGTSATYKSATNWTTYADYIIEPNTITFSVDSNLLNNENVLYSVDNNEQQKFTQTSFANEDVASLKVTSKTSDITILIGTTPGGSEIGTVTNATITYTFEADTTIYITKA